jgi:hypothetical protein
MVHEYRRHMFYYLWFDFCLDFFRKYDVSWNLILWQQHVCRCGIAMSENCIFPLVLLVFELTLLQVVSTTSNFPAFTKYTRNTFLTPTEAPVRFYMVSEVVQRHRSSTINLNSTEVKY